VDSLCGLPIDDIACGANHSMAVSASGAVYAWGKNAYGQLGLGDHKDRHYPTQVRSLRHQNVARVSCGAEHSACLTSDGGVFTFGHGGYGQLGHGGKSSEVLPRKVMELMGTDVTQVACGKLHTLAFVPSRGRLYSFGLGGSGQLGNDQKGRNASTPQVVLGPWANAKGETVVSPSKAGLSKDGLGKKTPVITLVAAFGDQSYACVCPTSAASSLQQDHRLPPPRSLAMLTLDEKMVLQIESASLASVLDEDFLENLEKVFQSKSCLNGSLLTAEHRPCGSKNFGANLDKWTAAYESVKKCQNETLKDAIFSAVTTFILPSLAKTPPDVETLRVFLTLPLYDKFEDASLYDELQTPYCSHIIALDKNPWRVVERWLAERDAPYLRRLVGNFKAVAVELLRKRKERNESGFRHQLEANLTFLRILNRINVESGTIDYEDFYIPEVSSSSLVFQLVFGKLKL